MPYLAYTVQDGEDLIIEKEYFIDKPKEKLIEIIQNEIITPWNRSRAEHGESLVTFVGIQIINPWIHAHQWVPGLASKFSGRHHYRCNKCGITGFKRLHLFNGEGTAIIRDEVFRKERFELCRDELKKLPKAKELKFR